MAFPTHRSRGALVARRTAGYQSIPGLVEDGSHENGCEENKPRRLGFVFCDRSATRRRSSVSSSLPARAPSLAREERDPSTSRSTPSRVNRVRRPAKSLPGPARCPVDARETIPRTRTDCVAGGSGAGARRGDARRRGPAAALRARLGLGSRRHSGDSRVRARPRPSEAGRAPPGDVVPWRNPILPTKTRKELGKDGEAEESAGECGAGEWEPEWRKLKRMARMRGAG